MKNIPFSALDVRYKVTFYEYTLRRDVFLVAVVCRVVYAKVVGTTSSEGLLFRSCCQRTCLMLKAG